MMSPNRHLGGRIRQAREEAALSQAELARKIGTKSERTVRGWESGEHAPHPKTLRKIAAATAKPLAFFVGGLWGIGVAAHWFAGMGGLMCQLDNGMALVSFHLPPLLG